MCVCVCVCVCETGGFPQGQAAKRSRDAPGHWRGGRSTPAGSDAGALFPEAGLTLIPTLSFSPTSSKHA